MKYYKVLPISALIFGLFLIVSPVNAVLQVDPNLVPPDTAPTEITTSNQPIEIEAPDAYGDPALNDDTSDPAIYTNTDEPPTTKGSTLPEYTDTFTAAGETLELNGYFKNDVIVAGNNITITGLVEGDVIAVGGNIIINAPVEGDIRLAGGNITLKQSIKRNATLFGGRIIIEPDAIIERDVYVQAGDLSMEGTIQGKLSGGAGNVVIDGSINDDVYFKNVGSVRLRSNANIDGDLFYSSSEEAIIDPAATIKGQTIYSPPLVEPKDQTSKFTSWFWILKITGLLGAWLLGVVILKIFERRSALVVKNMLAEVGRSFMWGGIYLFTVPAVLAILLFTLIGIPLSIFGILLFGVSLYLAKIYVGTAVGKLLLPRSTSLVSPMILGVSLVYIITESLGALPFPWFFLGTGITFIGIIWATGGIVLYLRDRFKTKDRSDSPDKATPKKLANKKSNAKHSNA